MSLNKIKLLFTNESEMIKKNKITYFYNPWWIVGYRPWSGVSTKFSAGE